MTPADLWKARVWVARLRTRVQDDGYAEMPYAEPLARRSVMEGLAAIHFLDGATLDELDLVRALSRAGQEAERLDDRTVDRMLLDLDRIAVELLIAHEVRL